jgi:predicted SnoaL-like aldol condensation-catalyzing enzyme
VQAGRLPPNDHRPDAPSGAPDSAGAARAIVAILETRDLDSVDAAVAADYVDHQGLGEREIRGREGFREVVEAVHYYADVRVSVEDIVAERDMAAVRLRWHGADASGEQVIRETLDLLRFVDGRLAEHWGAELPKARGRR